MTFEIPSVPSHSGAGRAMQVKFFNERGLEALEKSVNAWLGARPQREIVEVRQSVIPGSGGAGDREIILSVWYLDQ